MDSSEEEDLAILAYILIDEEKRKKNIGFGYMRMSPDRFQHLSLVGPYITKQKINFRAPISAPQRLALTLRFLATGEGRQSLSFSYRIGRSTVSKIVSETSLAIFHALRDPYLKTLTTEEEWLNIANGFEETWNFPHCIGALDGKHIRIECPKMTGTYYYNYKDFYSIVLLAICDSNYCLTLFYLGHYGSNNDSGVLSKSKIGELIENGALGTPDPSKYKSCNFDPLPYFLVEDEIFPLKTWLMRPYPGKLTKEQRIFNYRLSRARRTIENAFGIHSARRRILYSPIRAKVENVENYVLACLSLHNYLRITDNASYCPSGFVDSYDSTGKLKEGL
ncbi:uncharacterized protein [Clytia hemisphaerica]|uniref:uncharacterized protein n=1 Tax=Clytia hemisphaerica TaxID=252671 RepID=UPI0034D49AE6